MNESDPLEVLALSVKIITSISSSQASAGEKVAALKVAAFAIEQAAQAQQLAIVMANIVNSTRPKT